ncbi:hypothetical protein PENTCL1PPCAC_30240 [Pristionchus entomophagus]|uniref:G protein-coupled receptor n=1 Tax=Pristionchus entomophagus TaxID=358040 RepID=A0AAV5ULS2_9BILA|nr:hypothetical protein PENTCL1PPCAC_30240 [Pristionchus entomophagus]
MELTSITPCSQPPVKYILGRDKFIKPCIIIAGIHGIVLLRLALFCVEFPSMLLSRHALVITWRTMEDALLSRRLLGLNLTQKQFVLLMEAIWLVSTLKLTIHSTLRLHRTKASLITSTLDLRGILPGISTNGLTIRMLPSQSGPINFRIRSSVNVSTPPTSLYPFPPDRLVNTLWQRLLALKLVFPSLSLSRMPILNFLFTMDWMM